MKTLAASFALGLLCCAQAALLPARAEAAALEWEAAFPTSEAPERVYFRAHYFDGRGQRHEMEVWREGDRRLRRRTDGIVELVAVKNKDGELDLQAIDRRRGTLIRANRASLHHAGRFTGWRGLAHVLEKPRGAFQISTLTGYPEQPSAGGCVWFRLEATVPAANISDVCWSVEWGLPLAIMTVNETGERVAQFAINEVRAFEPEEGTFSADVRNLVEIDARLQGDLSD